MYTNAKSVFAAALAEIEQAGLWKHERLITSPQAAHVTTNGMEVVNFCANNYLGLSSHPRVIAAARAALDDRGYGLSSVRFICGTQDKHKELEAAISTFLGTEDTILYGSCFDANGGLFETVLGEDDAIISDALNHASIIDGIRLCKAERHRYEHDDLNDLEAKLKATQGKRLRMVATDGVFSMDGDIARVDAICDLADKYGAMVMVDDSHATGFVGKTGRGSAELRGCSNRVDVVTSTLGKALGGASGGFTSGKREIIDLLRNRSRPYLFSNTLAPPIVAGSIAAIALISESTALRDKLEANTQRFRAGMTAAGLAIRPGTHPITPVMLGDARLAAEMARQLLDHGIYVIGFSYPVVPKGQARIRVQISAAHSTEDIDRALSAFATVAKALGVPEREARGRAFPSAKREDERSRARSARIKMTADDIVAKIRVALPDARVEMQDLTGTSDHWKALIVSAAFAGKSLIERHRLVNAALAEELKGPIHALTFDAKAPGEP